MVFGRAVIIIITALLGLPILGVPADAEDSLTFDQGAHYVMLPACEIMRIMRYQKVGGEWVGGRSLLKGELPVTGSISTRLARSNMYVFDARMLRMRTDQLVGAAKVVNVEGLLFPDSMSPKFFRDSVDHMVKRLMADFDSDPLSNCHRYRAIRDEALAELFEAFP